MNMHKLVRCSLLIDLILFAFLFFSRNLQRLENQIPSMEKGRISVDFRSQKMTECRRKNVTFFFFFFFFRQGGDLFLRQILFLPEAKIANHI